jgi:phosphoribosylformimino-5-aminoimidazole carboxamide ribotide isomerase
MRFRPCLDLHEGKVKQIVGGTLRDNSLGLIENFVSQKDPEFFANLYKKDNLFGGHVIMLGKGNEMAAVKALNAFRNGLQVGGGINPENAKYFIEQGASHVIVTSYVFMDGKVDFNKLTELIESVGKEKLVLDLSCRKRDGKYFIVTNKWQKFTEIEISGESLDKLCKFCSEFLIHGVDVEGKCLGVEKNLIKIVSDWLNKREDNFPVTYAGGVSSFEDIDLIKDMGKDKLDFSIGSALDIFGGSLKYLMRSRLKNLIYLFPYPLLNQYLQKN